MNKKQNNAVWIIGAIVLVAIVLQGLRWMSAIQGKGPVLDEQYITVPINNLIVKGWSVETAIDFQETKGPAMIWPYAIVGEWLGGELNDLRFVSVLFSILAFAVLVWIAVRCKLYRQALYLVAIGWLLLPYNLVFSEIVMGESSFLFLSLLCVLAFLWGLDEESSVLQKKIAPILYCIALAIALHSRIHVVALAGGICIASWSLQGRGSWPWWLASLVAGILRIPLWEHWGGLVSPDYQSLHGLGFRFESLSYLAAAFVPFLGIFAVEAWRLNRARLAILVAFVAGCGLCMSAMPNLLIPDAIDFANENDRFQGIAATLTKTISEDLIIQRIILSLLSGFGLAGLAGLWYCKKEKAPVTACIIHDVCYWSLVFGWLLYAFTRGFVFDRFVLVWAFLLPIVWVQALPKKLLIGQYALLAIVAARLTSVWLM